MVTVYVVDAFTTVPDTGNRAGVVLDSDGLSEQDMQSIAKAAGYSETAFVLPSSAPDHALHVRYFTPTHEVPICGHATVATHFLRACKGYAPEYPMVVKTGAGNLPVSLTGAEGDRLVHMTQGQLEFFSPFDDAMRKKLAEALGVDASDFSELPIQVVSTGHSKVMIPLFDREKLDALKPDHEKLKVISAEVGSNGFFPFVLEGTSQKPVTYGRMFAPAIGINEDPVTGNANGPAGAYLVQNGLIECDSKVSYWGYQGIAMGNPGQILVTIERCVESLIVSIAGQAVLVGKRAIEI